MNEKNTNQKELDDLRREVKTLRRYRRIVHAQGKGLSFLGGISTFIFLGPELSLAISTWLKAKQSNIDNVPVEDTANLFAALIRRFIRVGLVAIVLALIPTALLFWQNLIMRDQYTALITQIDEQRAQTENQQITSYFSLLLSGDRKQFWAAVSFFSSSQSLTDEANSRLSRMLLESEGEGACSSLEALARLSPSRPLEDGMLVRDVTETLVLLIEHQKIPLGGIEIRELKCENLKLRQTGIAQLSLRNSNIKNSEFLYVDLSGTSFENSDLRGVHFLDGVQWTSEKAGRSTDFTDADLSYAYFRDEISSAVFNGAKLSGALFTWVTGNELNKMPIRYFKGAICMSPDEAKACHSWHLNNFRGQEQGNEKPSNCPAKIEHPIILVYGHESDRNECRAWVNGA